MPIVKLSWEIDQIWRKLRFVSSLLLESVKWEVDVLMPMEKMNLDSQQNSTKQPFVKTSLKGSVSMEINVDMLMGKTTSVARKYFYLNFPKISNLWFQSRSYIEEQTLNLNPLQADPIIPHNNMMDPSMSKSPHNSIQKSNFSRWSQPSLDVQYDEYKHDGRYGKPPGNEHDGQ